MNAETAAKLASKNRKHTAQRQLAADRASARRTELDIRKALRTEVPSQLRRIKKDIQAAVAEGRTSTDFSMNASSPVDGAVTKAIAEKLRDQGFVVDYQYFTREDDMGDFNAPCRITVEGFQGTIAWKKK